MPPIYTDRKIYVGVHELKTNIAKYIRILNSGDYEYMYVTKRGKPIGMFMTFEGNTLYNEKQEQAKMQASAGLLNGSDAELTGLLNGLVQTLKGV